jgi:hypothetical protein
VALWSVVVLLLLRGAADLLAVEPRAPATPAPRAAAVTWPDDEARAFAVEFARAYLGWSPRRPSEYERELQGFVSPELAASLVPELTGRGPDQTVQAATVARTATVDSDRALVTAAATAAPAPRSCASSPPSKARCAPPSSSTAGTRTDPATRADSHVPTTATTSTGEWMDDDGGCPTIRRSAT